MTFPDVDSESFDLTGELSALVDGATFSFPVTGSGTYDFPDISMNLTLTVGGTSDSFPVSGTVSNSADIMTLTDDEGDTITFRRQ